MIDLQQGDCLDLMKDIPDESVDMILADLPYGTTQNKWDSVISFSNLWSQYNRVIKDNGAIALFGQEPFSSLLRVSNKKMYRYDWVWKKSKPVGFLNARKMPLRSMEHISIFYKKLPTYNPQMSTGKAYVGVHKANDNTSGNNYGKVADRDYTFNNTGVRFPTDILSFKSVSNKSFHPTQKPVKLLEYLIKTYTNPGDVVLDNTMGSGSTGVAAVNLNRNFIGYELEPDYFDIATKRINEAIEDHE